MYLEILVCDEKPYSELLNEYLNISPVKDPILIYYLVLKVDAEQDIIVAPEL